MRLIDVKTLFEVPLSPSDGVSVWRSADFQSAVSQDSILLGVLEIGGAGQCLSPADYKSAIRQSATLRYDAKHADTRT